jgi:hypothetical protein
MQESNFLNIWATIIFSRRTVHHEINVLGITDWIKSIVIITSIIIIIIIIIL